MGWLSAPVIENNIEPKCCGFYLLNQFSFSKSVAGLSCYAENVPKTWMIYCLVQGGNNLVLMNFEKASLQLFIQKPNYFGLSVVESVCLAFVCDSSEVG